jgi:Uma2 family endonuclease
MGENEPRLMTVDDFVASEFFEDGFWELCEGELVRMASRPIHDIVVARMIQLFLNAIGDGECDVCGSTVGVRLDESNSFVMPDLSVVCDKSILGESWFLRSPELVVEVLSRATKNFVLGKKRDLFLKGGAKEFWVVDLDEKWIEVESFERGVRSRFEVGGLVRSWLFEEFEFLVDDVLRRVL